MDAREDRLQELGELLIGDPVQIRYGNTENDCFYQDTYFFGITDNNMVRVLTDIPIGRDSSIVLIEMHPLKVWAGPIDKSRVNLFDLMPIRAILEKLETEKVSA